jgi:hypothetical protein
MGEGAGTCVVFSGLMLPIRDVEVTLYSQGCPSSSRKLGQAVTYSASARNKRRKPPTASKVSRSPVSPRYNSLVAATNSASLPASGLRLHNSTQSGKACAPQQLLEHRMIKCRSHRTIERSIRPTMSSPMSFLWCNPRRNFLALEVGTLCTGTKAHQGR